MVAVDISNNQLDTLKTKCENFGDMLEVRCEDINDTLKNTRKKYDIIVFNSLLRGVPTTGDDQRSDNFLNPHGPSSSFQDPLRMIPLEKAP